MSACNFHTQITTVANKIGHKNIARSIFFGVKNLYWFGFKYFWLCNFPFLLTFIES